MHRFIPFAVVAMLFVACDRPQCNNTNPVFDRYSYEQKEYKAELIKQLKQADSNYISFWIDQYIEREGRAFMSIFIQDGHLCARGILDITDVPADDRLHHYKEKKGGGYSGAELKGLSFRVDSSDGDYHFIYENVKRIID